MDKIKPEESFDRLTSLASDVFETPISIIVLMGEDQQWFKSCVGMKNQELDRDPAFCNYTIYRESVFCVENALEDERFQENEFVLNPPEIRAYLGAPLITNSGFAIGTFCVIDDEPRSFSEKQKEQIQTFADEAMAQIQLKQRNADLNEVNNQLFTTRQKLHTKQERFEQMADNIEEVFWLWSADGDEVHYVNSAVEELFGVEPEDLYRDPWHWTQYIHSEDKDRVRSALESAWKGEFNLKFRIATGEADQPQWVQIQGFPIEKEEGQIKRMAGTARDITDEQRALQRLEKLARTDDLTELKNRHYFFEQLQERMGQADRNDTKISLLMIDIDNFKQINDTHGHLKGDEVLQRTADRIRDSIRDEDLAARYGGDEFVVLLPETNRDRAEEIAQRIIENAQDSEGGNDDDISVKMSVGVAEFDGRKNRQEIDEDQLLHQADNAMYHAKEISDRPIETRREPRHSIESEPASIKDHGDTVEVNLLDYSRHGLRIRGEMNLEVRDKITINFKLPKRGDEDFERKGQVVWTESDGKAQFAGIKLDTELDS